MEARGGKGMKRYNRTGLVGQKGGRGSVEFQDRHLEPNSSISTPGPGTEQGEGDVGSRFLEGTGGGFGTTGNESENLGKPGEKRDTPKKLFMGFSMRSNYRGRLKSHVTDGWQKSPKEFKGSQKLTMDLSKAIPP